MSEKKYENFSTYSFNDILIKPKSKKSLHFFGNIINVKPCVVRHKKYIQEFNINSKSIGYTYSIKTNMYFQTESGEIYPIYVIMTIKYKKNSNRCRSMYEWWKKYKGMYKKWIYDFTNWKKQNRKYYHNKSDYTRRYNEWLEENELVPLQSEYAPIRLNNGKKVKQVLGTNKYFKYVEKREKIIFIYINDQCNIDYIKKIPNQYQNLVISKNTKKSLITI